MVVVNRDGRVFYDSQGRVGVGRVSEVVRAVAEARDIRNLSPAQAQSWIVTTATALNELHRFGMVMRPRILLCEREVEPAGYEKEERASRIVTTTG